MQRFARKVIAWARFDRVAAYRRISVEENAREAQLTVASNVIGKYWKRKGEKEVLAIRFKNRATVRNFVQSIWWGLY